MTFTCPECKAALEVTTTLPPHPSKDTNGLCAMSGLLPATVTRWSEAAR